MPIFNYSCNKCKHEQEVLTTRVSETPVLKCEQCGSDDMTKLLSGGLHFVLIGEGWAEDGYQYNYTKSLAGTEEKVKPVYDRKKAQETLKKYYENTFEPFKQEKI